MQSLNSLARCLETLLILRATVSRNLNSEEFFLNNHT